MEINAILLQKKKRFTDQSLSLRNSGAKYVGNAEAISNFFSLPWQCVGKKNGQRLNRYLCILQRQWLRHASAFCQVLFDF